MPDCINYLKSQPGRFIILTTEISVKTVWNYCRDSMIDTRILLFFAIKTIAFLQNSFIFLTELIGGLAQLARAAES